MSDSVIQNTPRLTQRVQWPACRDLKLENIFLSKEGDVMLGDYGLTMSTMQELAVSPVGTVEYMAPEVWWLPL